MVEDTDVVADNDLFLPPHMKQAAKAVALLLFFSLLMFSLPFGAFFGVKYILKDYYFIDGYRNTVWSVVAAVVTVYLIIGVYAYIAYHDTEYDDEGNEIKEPNKSDLNLKQDNSTVYKVPLAQDIDFSKINHKSKRFINPVSCFYMFIDGYYINTYIVSPDGVPYALRRKASRWFYYITRTRQVAFQYIFLILPRQHSSGYVQPLE
ncbi:hypothetical protein NQ317_016018 [Molorchus minor]|uniref:Uncharacterized protein n=1 Tax=Molorchus minor TaxID=1323400 RepID=A0ABQ9JT83_9CUCU|nr:hypothetical protein NQ317_016018 [Molorchus minor]